jgi:molybdopterin synthase catalytic subunit
MRVRLLAFASASDALGRGSLEIELVEGSRLADLRAHLTGLYPALEALWPRLAVAVDGELAGGEAALAEDCEVALLPPVSGGAPAAPVAAAVVVPALRAALVETAIDVPAVVAAVSAPERGAVVLFLGTVRDHHRGRAVTALTYTAYRPMAEARLAAIVADVEASHPGLQAAIVHRLGRLLPGEPSVAIAVASPHRAAAYEASRTALERLKTEVPIWKREHYADGGAAWREEEPLAAAAPPAAGLRP